MMQRGGFNWRWRRRERGELRRKILVFRGDCCPDERCLARLGLETVKRLPLVNAVVAHFPAKAGVEALAMPPEIVRVDDDLILYVTGGPGPTEEERPDGVPRWRQPLRRLCPRCRRKSPPGPAQSLPWGVEYVNAPRAWLFTRGAGVKVGVIDTGVDLGHPDLKRRIAGGYNVLKPGRDPVDDNGHGTHVAGTIGAEDNGIGVVGVAPKAGIYAIKALDRYGIGFLSDLIEGLQWCIRNGMQVVNLSLGTNEDNHTFREAVRRAWQAGLTVVAAAGNNGPADGTVEYPGRYQEVICVSAIGTDGRLARFASRGPEVAVIAPGVDVVSAWPGGGYRSLSGTSMAAPHVAGVAALLKAMRPGLSPGEVRQRLTVTSRRLIGVRWGLVNALRAVQWP